eukprot:1157363-Pelagomonas_calceolata.AAC.10
MYSQVTRGLAQTQWHHRERVALVPRLTWPQTPSGPGTDLLELLLGIHRRRRLHAGSTSHSAMVLERVTPGRFDQLESRPIIECGS